MSTVYFLGAGASAADGLPLTSELSYGVASYVSNSEVGDELLAYYNDMYGIKPESLRVPGETWRRHLENRRIRLSDVPNSLPDLIETLSLLDVCIADDLSLGSSSLEEREDYPREMDAAFLRKARSQLARTIALVVQDAGSGHSFPHARSLMKLLQPGDAIVTTNWDLLPEQCLAGLSDLYDSQPESRKSPIRYFCVGERPVNRNGDDLDGYTADSWPVLRLHGGLNWFGCACCGTVYVNLGGGYVMNEDDRRRDFDYCHCQAGLTTMMVAPSFIKDYRSVSLRSVWREAQKRLEAADKWVFIGYSLPSDDFHIRSMLLRALRSSMEQDSCPTVAVYLGPGAESAGLRFQDLLRLASPDVRYTGLQGFLADERSTVE